MKIIRIKPISSFFLLMLTLLACNNPASISGKLEGIEQTGMKIYLIQPETLREVAASYLGRVIDSAAITSDGSFKFLNLPKNKAPLVLELVIQPSGKSSNFVETEDVVKSNYMPILYQSGESLYITATVDEFQKSVLIEQPSAINKALLKLRDIHQNAYHTYLAGREWDLEDGNELLEKEQALLNYQTELMKFADSTYYLIPALVALRWVSPVTDYERVPEFLVRQCTKWKKEQPDHPWVQQLCDQSEPSKLPVLLGDRFPDFELPMINKDTLAIKDQLGKKLTIIDLWASWCGPCRKENRAILIPLWNDYHDQGLQIIGYALESDATTWKSAVEKDGANLWLQASDLQGDDTAFMKRIRVQTIPANFILDDKGLVLAKNVHGKALMDWVQCYMQKKN